jgi:hypothetical protein
MLSGSVFYVRINVIFMRLLDFEIQYLSTLQPIRHHISLPESPKRLPHDVAPKFNIHQP